MIFKEPLNIEVILDLIKEVLNKTGEQLKLAQDYDKESGFDVIEKDKVIELFNHFYENKSLYGKVQNDEVYYNREVEINLKLNKDFSVYDMIYLALGVLLTQNRANFFVKKINPSFSFNLIINLIIKFSQSLRLYDECIKIIEIEPKSKLSYDFELIKKEDKIIYKTKTLEVEYDYNLLLKAYPIKR